eukprot:COSAG01_NODE_862_length_13058_cov_6.823366_12_plen_79_part_00
MKVVQQIARGQTRRRLRHALINEWRLSTAQGRCVAASYAPSAKRISTTSGACVGGATHKFYFAINYKKMFTPPKTAPK